MAEPLPVVLVTGFLGSGKTTLLQRLLGQPAFGEAAVIVNELGEVAVDHHLLRRVDERTVVLGNGCVCCTLRGDLSDELRSLLSRRTRGEIPPFRRVVVETTGLADPAPILNTLVSEPVVQHHFSTESVVATVDALNGFDQLDEYAESLQQAAAADTIVLTKTDVADTSSTARLSSRLRELNPAARVLEVSFGEVDAATLLEAPERAARRSPAPVVVHRDDVRSFCIRLDATVDWTAFGIWLSMLLAARGKDILRVKGMIDVGGDGPLLLNGVQHVVHPPVHLAAWPNGRRSSELVFITRGVEAADVEASLTAFQRAARG